MAAPRELRNLHKGDIVDHGAMAAREDLTAPADVQRAHTTPKGIVAEPDKGPNVGASTNKPH